MNEENKKNYIEKLADIANEEVATLLRKEWNNNPEIENDIGVVTEILRNLITVVRKINQQSYDSNLEELSPQ
jgi:glutaredoxin 2